MSATSADRIKNPSKFDDLMKNVEIIENLKFKIFDFLMFPEVRRELRRAPKRVWLALVSEEGVVVSEQTKCFFHQNESSKIILIYINFAYITSDEHLMKNLDGIGDEATHRDKNYLIKRYFWCFLFSFQKKQIGFVCLC